MPNFHWIACMAFVACLSTATPARATTLPDDANTTCPVMPKEDVDPDMSVQYKGKTIYVCCTKCKRKFNQDPEKYMKRIAEDKKNKTAAAEKAKEPKK